MRLAHTAGWLAAFALAAPAPAAQAAPGDPARVGGTTIKVVAGLPAFKGSSAPLGAAERKAMTGPVWRTGCPVGPGSLRKVTARYVGFDGHAHGGAIVVHRVHAAATLRVLRRLYEAHFPIRRMKPIEAYDGSDNASIEADNTSAFNCRAVTGGTGWSEHSYGRAIDLNTIENPYVYADGTTSHPASRTYLARSSIRPGMAVPGGILVRAFAEQGWKWGGNWKGIKDFQHFSPTGR
jgi:hypothetical protein